MQMLFGGEVHPAPCDCHKGQWVAVIFAYMPETDDRTMIANKLFPTEADAEKDLPDLVNACADEILAKMGLKRDEALAVEIGGQELFDRYQNGRNPNLH